MRKAVAGLVAGLVIGVACSAGATAKNDTVYHEDSYQEFFKQEGSGDKNYLYTRTVQDAPPPGKCNVYTFASETAGAVVCNIPGDQR